MRMMVVLLTMHLGSSVHWHVSVMKGLHLIWRTGQCYTLFYVCSPAPLVMMADSYSMSKKKRLNRKAKQTRLELSLNEEKNKRSTAESSSRHWKEKATFYKRSCWAS